MEPLLGMAVAWPRTEPGLVLMPEADARGGAPAPTVNKRTCTMRRTKGMLKAGMLADMIVIDRDYMTCPLVTYRIRGC